MVTLHHLDSLSFGFPIYKLKGFELISWKMLPFYEGGATRGASQRLLSGQLRAKSLWICDCPVIDNDLWASGALLGSRY